MAHVSEHSPGTPTGDRPPRFRLAPRRSAPEAVTVSDDQILALVTAAQRLSRRQRERSKEAGSAAAEERLVRLDWAVRAGCLALAGRAAGRTAAAEAAERHGPRL